MNKIVRKVFMVASLFSAGLLTSCEMDDPEVERTEVSSMSGEWFVKYEVQDSTGAWEDISGYTKLLTSSTSANTATEMWLGDILSDPRAINFADANFRGTFWTYMVRTNVDLGSKTFNANDKSIAVEAAKSETPTKPAVPATPYDINVKITEGQIIEDGSTPPSGAVTDSIIFKVEFEDDPGVIYRASGYKRTGFLEDEH
ncbi:lipid-binding protein [Adhaeribacter terreus]|uniref:Lipid-binding protein n=1 Tax=Adhaeribacter terreus TaxID=529703 RepID=A0ABW0EG48_9BACT